MGRAPTPNPTRPVTSYERHRSPACHASDLRADRRRPQRRVQRRVGTGGGELHQGCGGIGPDHRRVPAPCAGERSRRPGYTDVQSSDPDHQSAAPDERCQAGHHGRAGGRQAVPHRGQPVAWYSGDPGAWQAGRHRDHPVRRIPRRPDPRGGHRLVRAGRRRLGVVLRRRRLQLRRRQGRRHQWHLGSR